MTNDALGALQQMADAVLDGRLEEAASWYVTPLPIFIGPQLITCMTQADMVARLSTYHQAFVQAGVQSVKGRLTLQSAQRRDQIRYVVAWRYRLQSGTNDLITRMAFFCSAAIEHNLRIHMVEYLTPPIVAGLARDQTSAVE